MTGAIVRAGIVRGGLLGAGLGALAAMFVVLPGIEPGGGLRLLMLDAVAFGIIAAIGAGVGLLHGLVLGIVVAVVWRKAILRASADVALDVAAASVALVLVVAWTVSAGPESVSVALVLSVVAGGLARDALRTLVTHRDPAAPPAYHTRGRLYVETRIDAPLERVWALTQHPAQHARWDLRFGRIVPRGEGADGRRFTYSTFGVSGTGVHAGDRWRADGGATSSLRFGSSHVLSPIGEGAGCWRYEPTAGGLRFITGYDYRARYPRVDLMFRPLMGWATAWSFDRLRLWAERGQDPRWSLGFAGADLAMRLVGVLAAGLVGGPVAAIAALLLLRWIPMPPQVPAARRCRRRPLDERSAASPGDLHRLGAPR